MLAILCGACVIRIACLEFGLPQWQYSAEANTILKLSNAAESVPREYDPIGLSRLNQWIKDRTHWPYFFENQRILNAFLGCAAVLLVWAVADMFFGSASALLAAALLALHPIASFWPRFSLGESVMGLLWLTGLYLLRTPSSGKARQKFFWAGFLLAVGSFNGIFAVFVWCLVLYNPASTKSAASRSLVFLILPGLAILVAGNPILLGVSLSILAVGALLYHAGRWTGVDSEDAIRLIRSHWAIRGAVVALVINMLIFDRDQLQNLPSFDALYAAASPASLGLGAISVAIAASIGIGWAFAKAKWSDLAWLGYAVLAILAGLVAKDHPSSSGAASAPIICIFAAHGILNAADALRRAFQTAARSIPFRPVLVVLALSLPLASSVGYIERMSKTPTYERAAEWLRETVKPGAKVIIEDGALEISDCDFEVIHIRSLNDIPEEFYAEEGDRYIAMRVSSLTQQGSSISDNSARKKQMTTLIRAAKGGAATFAGSASLIGPTIIVIAI
ncbi:MAG: hypothetical protein JW941_09455 [Candidatus Coatesbacteria bacterium]|nr:hypothetical protein [Candidatus Coatesbacteria bacterium]